LANSAHSLASLRYRSALLTGSCIVSSKWAGAQPTPHALHHAGRLSPSRPPQKMTWSAHGAHHRHSLGTMTFQPRSRLRRSPPISGKTLRRQCDNFGGFLGRRHDVPSVLQIINSRQHPAMTSSSLSAVLLGPARPGSGTSRPAASSSRQRAKCCAPDTSRPRSACRR
jgi:hypothetical protein